jgi:hypothetical protein
MAGSLLRSARSWQRPEDDGQAVVEVVGHARGQLAQGTQLVGHHHLFL